MDTTSSEGYNSMTYTGGVSGTTGKEASGSGYKSTGYGYGDKSTNTETYGSGKKDSAKYSYKTKTKTLSQNDTFQPVYKRIACVRYVRPMATSTTNNGWSGYGNYGGYNYPYCYNPYYPNTCNPMPGECPYTTTLIIPPRAKRLYRPVNEENLCPPLYKLQDGICNPPPKRTPPPKPKPKPPVDRTKLLKKYLKDVKKHKTPSPVKIKKIKSKPKKKKSKPKEKKKKEKKKTRTKEKKKPPPKEKKKRPKSRPPPPPPPSTPKTEPKTPEESRKITPTGSSSSSVLAPVNDYNFNTQEHALIYRSKAIRRTSSVGDIMTMAKEDDVHAENVIVAPKWRKK